MRLVAGTRGCVGELARIGLGMRDQLADRARRKARMHDEDRGAVGDLGDRREAPDRVVAGILHQCRHHAERRAGADQQRVAVGLGAGHRLRSERAARARPVLDHHALSEARWHHLRDHAGGDVGRSARSERHDQLDGLGRIGLRLGWRDVGESNCQGGEDARVCQPPRISGNSRHRTFLRTQDSKALRPHLLTIGFSPPAVLTPSVAHSPPATAACAARSRPPCRVAAASPARRRRAASWRARAAPTSMI